MFTKKLVVGAFTAAILAAPALSACGHTGPSVAPAPTAVPTEQPPAAVPDSGTGASWSNGASNGNGTSSVPTTSDSTDTGSAGSNADANAPSTSNIGNGAGSVSLDPPLGTDSDTWTSPLPPGDDAGRPGYQSPPDITEMEHNGIE